MQQHIHRSAHELARLIRDGQATSVDEVEMRRSVADRCTPVLVALPIALVLLASSPGSAQSLQSFQDLALRVNLDDRLRVEDQSGARTTGRLTRLTGDEMTIETDAGEKRFTSATVRKVAVRGYSLGKSALIGAVVFPVLLAAAPACRSNPDCILVAAAPIGAGVGLAVGALIPRMATVVRAQEKRASLSPEFSRGAIGVRTSLRW